MPEWVTPHSEPLSKLALLGSRLARLRGAVKDGEDPVRLRGAAEKVRLAQLSVIKAKLALIREYPQRDLDGRQAAKLHEDRARWQTIDPVEIIERYRRPGA